MPKKYDEDVITKDTVVEPEEEISNRIKKLKVKKSEVMPQLSGISPDRRLTPTETRILDLLADGKGHSPSEVQGCLLCEDSSSLYFYIKTLRRYLAPKGADITIRYDRKKLYYRLVILIDTTE